jgi:hypothetical protein
MDNRKAISEKICPIFCELNATKKRHAEVWLSFADLGIFTSDHYYALKVKMYPGEFRKFTELSDIIHALHEKAKEEAKRIKKISIIKYEDGKHCKKKDVMVYCDEMIVAGK